MLEASFTKDRRIHVQCTNLPGLLTIEFGKYSMCLKINRFGDNPLMLKIFGTNYLASIQKSPAIGNPFTIELHVAVTVTKVQMIGKNAKIIHMLAKNAHNAGHTPVVAQIDDIGSGHPNFYLCEP